MMVKFLTFRIGADPLHSTTRSSLVSPEVGPHWPFLFLEEFS